ncbi:MAG TPA: M56 family metallopeptidase [Polyangia bacterium]|jgi:hypothetical protein
MNRDLVLATLALGSCGAATWSAGWIFRAPGGDRDGTEGDRAGHALERASWRRLWSPLFPAALALAVLIGWGLQEPGETDELLRPLAALAIAPFALIWLRAAWRAAWALRPPARPPLAATVGVVRPRVQLAERLRRDLDDDQLAAVLAHEEAHVRHHDPLRLWLAQLATDLQWPNPAARARLRDWQSSLELARDEDARRTGIAGEDLAAAIVATARLDGHRREEALAYLTGAEHELVDRVRRLLAPLSTTTEAGRRVLFTSVAVVAATLLLSLLAGFRFGDSLIRALPIIMT